MHSVMPCCGQMQGLVLSVEPVSEVLHSSQTESLRGKRRGLELSVKPCAGLREGRCPAEVKVQRQVNQTCGWSLCCHASQDTER